MLTSSDFALDEAVLGARKSITACVVVGGSLFADPDSLRALRAATRRGVGVRLLFPSPHSAWLQSFARDAGHDPETYSERVAALAVRTAAALPDAQVRRYEAPGPCWFVLIDDSVLFTKPFNAMRPTIPVRERLEPFIEHFRLLSEQLWACAGGWPDGLNDRTPDSAKQPLIYLSTFSEEMIARLAPKQARHEQ